MPTKKAGTSLQTALISVRRSGLEEASASFQTEPIHQSWVTDLDKNGRFEVLVWSVSAKGGNYGALHTYEWGGADLSKMQFPDLTEEQKTGYMGYDDFRVEGDKVIRSFPINAGKELDMPRQSGEMKVISYSYVDGQWRMTDEQP